ncbi:MAG: thioredoxin domain-containing protein [Odoribacter sp.]
MKHTILYGMIGLLLLVNTAQGQGIEFFQGSFAELVKKAQSEQKNVFVDFYAVWCGPCKAMANGVFKDAEIGTYFNGKMISYQINAEDKAFIEEVKRYEVQAYPTLLILNPAGEVLNKQVGACDKMQLMKFARVANGDQISFEKRYELLKQNKNQDEWVRSLLLDAPEYLVRLEGSNRDRWDLRIEGLYKDYRKRKSIDQWMNPEDFKILMLYHTESSENDEVLNYIMGHYDEVLKSVGQDDVYKFVFSLHMFLMQDQARKGDLAYLKSMEHIRGDMKQLYEALMNFGGKDIYTGLKYLNDGYYYLYSKKDVDKYFELMDEYVKYLGDIITAGDYLSMVDALSEATNNKMSSKFCTKYVEWLTAASQHEISVDDKLNCLIMLGDSYKGLKNTEMAKKCYKQAYAVSLQFDNPGLSAMIQSYVTRLEAE